MRVAKIVDNYTLAITRDGHDPMVGECFTVGGMEIRDPETDEFLGRLPELRVKATQVYEKFFVAETYLVGRLGSTGKRRLDEKLAEVQITVNVGDEVRPL